MSMPASTTESAAAGREPASVRADGEVLRFAGALSRAQVPALWKRLPPLAGVRVIDLREVSSVDSAGLALLAEIAHRAGGAAIEGAPAGLAELRSAYRLNAGLA